MHAIHSKTIKPYPTSNKKQNNKVKKWIWEYRKNKDFIQWLHIFIDNSR